MRYGRWKSVLILEIPVNEVGVAVEMEDGGILPYLILNGSLTL